jgi:uroporphyrinogen decarboxylase
MLLAPRERMTRAFCLEEPDRVPVFEQEIQPPTSDMVLGRTCTVGNKKLNIEVREKGHFNLRLLNRKAKDIIDLAEKLKLDAIVLGTNTEPGNFVPLKRISKREWRDENGYAIYYFPESDQMSKVDLKIRQKGVDGLKDRIKELKDPIDVGPENFYVFNKVKKEIERKKLDLFIFTSSLVFGWHGSWMDSALKWLCTEPNLMIEYLEAFNRRAVEVTKMAIDMGAEAVLDGGDFAYRHGPMFSPEMYRKFILPYQRLHSNVFHNKGVFVVNRSDGWIWPVADDFLVNSGVDGYCEIDKSSRMDLGDLKDAYGDRICLLGNVDCAGTLVRGNVGDVIEETRDCIRKAAPGGGYILCSSNVIHRGVKPQNYLAMLGASCKYGKYS